MAKQPVKRGTYLIEYWDGQKIICGNNYKPWYVHASEYAMDHYRKAAKAGQQPPSDRLDLITAVSYSEAPFADDGGLKYATIAAYDEIVAELNAKAGKIVYVPVRNSRFDPVTFELKKLEKELKSW